MQRIQAAHLFCCMLVCSLPPSAFAGSERVCAALGFQMHHLCDCNTRAAPLHCGHTVASFDILIHQAADRGASRQRALLAQQQARLAEQQRDPCVRQLQHNARVAKQRDLPAAAPPSRAQLAQQKLRLALHRRQQAPAAAAPAEAPAPEPAPAVQPIQAAAGPAHPGVLHFCEGQGVVQILRLLFLPRLA